MGDRKPFIGIVAAEDPLAISGKFVMNSPYIRALQQAEGLPLLIPHIDDDEAAVEEAAAGYAGLIDGLLLSGGHDVSPFMYGEEPAPTVTYTLAERDLLESALLRESVKRGIPVFGICRGIQLMNAAFGGTLWQELGDREGEKICHNQMILNKQEIVHHVEIAEGTLLAEIMGAGKLAVNSHHHQAVRDVAPGFTVSAVAPDGVIEGIENVELGMYAVQWHPEELYERHPHFMKLFTCLVGKAAEYAGKQRA